MLGLLLPKLRQRSHNCLPINRTSDQYFEHSEPNPIEYQLTQVVKWIVNEVGVDKFNALFLFHQAEPLIDFAWISDLLLTPSRYCIRGSSNHATSILGMRRRGRCQLFADFIVVLAVSVAVTTVLIVIVIVFIMVISFINAMFSFW